MAADPRSASAFAGARRAPPQAARVRADAAAAGVPAAHLPGADRRAAQARDREPGSRATRCRARSRRWTHWNRTDVPPAERLRRRRRRPRRAARQRRCRRAGAPPELRSAGRALAGDEHLPRAAARGRDDARRGQGAADRARRALGRDRSTGRRSPRTARAGPPTTCSPRSTCGATREGDVERMPPDQRVFGRILARTFEISADRHAVLPAARLSARLLAEHAAGPPGQRADDPGAGAVLDLDPGARGGLDRAAAVGRAWSTGR